MSPPSSPSTSSASSRPSDNQVPCSTDLSSIITHSTDSGEAKLRDLKISDQQSGRCATLTALAYEVTSESWNGLGMTSATKDIGIITERIVAILLIRVIATLGSRRAPSSSSPTTRQPSDGSTSEDGNNSSFQYSDLSTTTICRTAMKENLPDSWDEFITEDIIAQLRTYVRTICEGYRTVPYHNVEHAYHVVISANKLLDLMLCDDITEEEGGTKNNNSNRRFRPSYGIGADPLSQLAFIFSALVHDVDHQGISNQQLVDESDELAILYNDQSVAEQRSLAVAFSVLMKPEFEPLRSLIFPAKTEFARFRKLVINLVLSTDIASPERVQVVKSKWKEAFGPTKESNERKMRTSKIRGGKRRSSMLSCSQTQASELPTQPEEETPEIPSTIQNLSIPSANGTGEEDWQTQPTPEDITDDKRKTLLTQFFEFRGSMMNLGSHPPENNLETNRDFGHDSCDGSSYISLSPSVSCSDFNSSQLSFGFKEDSDDGVIKSGVTSSARTFLTETKKPVDSCENPNNESVAASSQSVGLAPLAKIERRHSTADSSRYSRQSSTVSLCLDDIENDRRNFSEKMASHSPKGHSVGSSPKAIPDRYQYSTSEIDNQVQAKRRSKMSRRLSAPTFTKPRTHEFRLGIRRALDLTGNAIEAFKNNSSFQTHLTQETLLHDLDEPDELKASVVLEQMLKAADVAALLQGFEVMKKWSTRLFAELKTSHDAGRGFDPSPNWYQGQITFLSSYALPLARNLADTGVFRDDIWPIFEQNVKTSRSVWMEEGMDITNSMIVAWEVGELNGDNL